MPSSSGTSPSAIVLCRAVTGLATVRALHREGVDVHAFVFAEHDVIRHTRCATLVDVPESAHGGDALVAFLLDYVAHHVSLGGRPVVIPTSDEHALLLAQHAPRLRAHCRVWTTDIDELTHIVSKDGLYSIAQALDVPTVPSIIAPALDELTEWSRSNPAPYFLKPFYVGVAGSKLKHKNLTIDTRAELLDYVARNGAQALIVQRLIRGGDGYVFDCYGLCDAQGRIVSMATHRRWRQHRPDCGATSFGEIPAGLPDAGEQALLAQTERLLSGMRYHGIFGIEWLQDRETGVLHLIDFNARPFMSLGHLTDSGLNLPALAYRELVGTLPARVERVPQLKHLWWVDLLRDLQTFREQRAHGRITFAEWLRSVLKCRSAAYLDWRDPGPGAARAYELLRQLVGLLLKRGATIEYSEGAAVEGTRSKTF